ncbi:hypothetical protein FACS1894125_4360 [Actinomycetota bacterium]|nr:hypothetical protein FACS1894125_4360 [Actinomycetota bacterium]
MLSNEYCLQFCPPPKITKEAPIVGISARKPGNDIDSFMKSVPDRINKNPHQGRTVFTSLDSSLTNTSKPPNASSHILDGVT